MTTANTDHRKITVDDQGDYGPCFACNGSQYHEDTCPLFCQCDKCQNADDAQGGPEYWMAGVMRLTTLEPITDVVEATRAVVALTGIEQEIGTEDAMNGMYLIQITDTDRAQLVKYGDLMKVVGGYELYIDAGEAAEAQEEEEQ